MECGDHHRFHPLEPALGDNRSCAVAEARSNEDNAQEVAAGVYFYGPQMSVAIDNAEHPDKPEGDTHSRVPRGPRAAAGKT